ncbi:MAG: hypothetical protein ACI8W8_002620 [Rhodothermales bacterium]|jgi:hypothetical protein
MLGECMAGELKGAKLSIHPCEVTTWEDWRSRHPKTSCLALSRSFDRYERSFYRDLSNYVILYSRLGKAKAWSFDSLRQNPVINDAFAGQQILVVFDAESTLARIYQRNVLGRTLSFEARDGTLRDRETRSLWDLRSLEASSGLLKGQSLRPEVGVLANTKAWRSFYPDGILWQDEP